MKFSEGGITGGQQQRVAIASGSDILLADEPTGALDGVELMALLQQLNERGKTIILVTHDQEAANHARRTIHISDGRIFVPMI